MTRHAHTGIAYATIGVAVLAFLILVKMYWIFTVDDAYITWRYSKHIAEGYGIRWNIDDDPPTEGYTTFLWMWIMVVPHALGWDPETFAKIIGVLSMLGTVAVAHQIFKRVNKECAIWLTAGFAIAFLANPITAVHAVSGMETALYVFLLAATAYLALRADAEPTERNLFTLFATGFVLFLTRPEGAIVTAAVLALLLWRHPAERKIIIKTSVLGFGVPFIIYNAWRIWYFHELLPLPFYVKMLKSNSIISIILYDVIDMGVLAVPLAIIAAQHDKTHDIFKNPASQTLFVVGISNILLYLSSAKIMDYFFRYWWPGIVCILLAAGATLMRKKRRVSYLEPIIIGTLLALIFTAITYFGAVRPIIYGIGLKNAHMNLALALKDINVHTAAVGDSGIIPYISDQTHFYDLGGLTTKAFAKERGDDKYILAAEFGTDVITYRGRFERISKTARVVTLLNRGGYYMCDIPFVYKWDYYLFVFVKHKEWCNTFQKYAEVSMQNYNRIGYDRGEVENLQRVLQSAMHITN